ncbi:dolichyl-P-Man:Man(5)GlcNAc(2)-PP-dolichyl mannosyltransferase [Meira miltonrushii]|uniref:Dol-P-Man:Man(5)GlcNAc(2)-PP-Dol alpha-1,3-mannosyltransferase n=1 Tax=Meira miltonrushii TaxID=1280837 RepID=A0A316V8K4_9BASI|nr:dolichyl-P-Man:Man(5)GlcNAc(2)-PP-dolichyl mannosyltransferase [Meira miltonrushii]PWN33544.1 dolichyl-P-Man:Man(5)GlcNAc(2)-PP-dolichyl mannosyltransferase [Meira miltonrushii]
MASARAQAISGDAIRLRQGTSSPTVTPTQRQYTLEDDELQFAWLKRVLWRSLWTPYNYWTLAAICLLTEVVFVTIITVAIRFTEIDFQTYMQQVDVYQKGERTYDKISGDTGPCVYPAMHLYIYSFLSFVSEGGKKLVPAQIVFGGLYIVTQFLTMAIYKSARIPPIIMFPLLLSKRLHSIYVLRLFNDCWAVAIMYGSIWAMTKAHWGAASILYSLALGTKMNILLYAPAMAAIYLRALGLQRSAVEAAKVILIQILIGSPFLLHDPQAYLSSAFDLSRAFLYKWTVNWRFFDEQTFLSQGFARVLLLLHGLSIALWLFTRWTGIWKTGLRWIRIFSAPPSTTTMTQTEARIRQPSGPFIVTALFTCNLIGITFARSLHYQFYSWYAQQIPLLVYLTNLPNLIKIALPLAIELAWNTYPSTKQSSMLLFVSHILILFGLWRSKQDDETLDEVRPDEEAITKALLQSYESPSLRKEE